MRKIIAFILMFIISLELALSLGTMPAQSNFYGNQEHSGKFFIVPSSNLPTRITIGLEGELKDNVDTIEELIIIGQQEINFTLTGPFEPGEQKANIVVYEEQVGSGTVTSKPSVHHSVILFVPYPEEYLETDLLIIDNSLHLLRFTTIMRNRGAVTIEDIENELNLYDNEEKLASMYKSALVNGFYDVILGYNIQGNTEPKILALPKETFTIEPGKSHENQLTIKKLLFKPGEYDAESVIKFSGKELKETGSFRIGDEEIFIFLETEKAVVDEINRIELLLGSNWNKELEDVNLTADIIKNDTIIATMNSEEIDIRPNRNSSVRLHWESYELELGSYELKTKAYYQDRPFEETFTIELAEKEKIEPSMVFVMTGLAMLVVVMLVIIIILKKKHKKRKK
ncbi:hypothetical protein ACFLZ6_01910 [Nanoarchaeota archaeon]